MVVAFSATRVYELAERIRSKRGGAAVVIGALSPRARNAQVALFQSGEVDTLVATDAIGMGLNLDVDNVVFAELSKFDGRESRRLDDAELAQIAGRAGRHTRDGRFATLQPLPPLPPPTARALERHRFPPDEQVFWRNHDLELDSVDGLLASLRRRPSAPWLRLADDAEDLRAATALARLPEVRALASGRDARAADVGGLPDPGLPAASVRRSLQAAGRHLPAALPPRRAPGPALDGGAPAAAGAPGGRPGDAAGAHVGGADLDVHHRAPRVGGRRAHLAEAAPTSSRTA